MVGGSMVMQSCTSPVKTVAKDPDIVFILADNSFPNWEEYNKKVILIMIICGW